MILAVPVSSADAVGASESGVKRKKMTHTSERKYSIRYEGNNSKRWDGRIIKLDGEWLESLYERSVLIEGKRVDQPWALKGGAIQVWKGVIVKEDEEKVIQGIAEMGECLYLRCT